MATTKSRTWRCQLLPVGNGGICGLTSAKQMHQSSHQTFRVSFVREYILPATKIREMISNDQVKAYTSPALLSSPPRGGGLELDIMEEDCQTMELAT